MNQYKDTTQQPNTLQTLKTAQNDNRTKVTLLDMVKSILLAVLMIGLLLLISSYHQAHPKNNLQSVAGVGQNNATTKLLAVKPNRHSLAIFIPKIHGATNPMSTTGIKQRHIYSLLPIQSGSNASYGGLIRPNTIAFMVNKSSRLVTVVETRPPYTGLGNNTTKLQGVANNG